MLRASVDVEIWGSRSDPLSRMALPKPVAASIRIGTTPVSGRGAVCRLLFARTGKEIILMGSEVLEHDKGRPRFL